jgi:hypothetical protein
MEQIQRPQIDGSTGQISPARRLGHDAASPGRVSRSVHAVFYHETIGGKRAFVGRCAAVTIRATVRLDRFIDNPIGLPHTWLCM